jgi:hypothetical protein
MSYAEMLDAFSSALYLYKQSKYSLMSSGPFNDNNNNNKPSPLIGGIKGGIQASQYSSSTTTTVKGKRVQHWNKEFLVHPVHAAEAIWISFHSIPHAYTNLLFNYKHQCKLSKHKKCQQDHQEREAVEEDDKV